MSDEIEEVSESSDAVLQKRLLQAEGQIQALAQVVMYLMAELETRHGLDSESVETCMKSQHWDGALLEPSAKNMMHEIADRLADARRYRLYKMLYERYGLDIDLTDPN